MLFSFHCPACKGKLEADASLSGSQADCPQCGRPVAIPEPRVAAGTTLAGFRLERRLGKGGMGEVYLATQLSVKRQVAVKILPPGFAENPQAVKRFLHEGQLAARLDHANIVTVHEAGEDSGNYYLAMAYIEGESLDQCLKRDKVLPEAEALAIIRTIAEALAYAWDEFQLLHRDLKPANIMVDRRGRVFLMDLGLAKSLGEESGMTLSGSIVGTPQYMSPEQAQGLADLGVPTDVYALGATLYHLVTGSPPFTGETTLTVLHKHMYEPLPPPRSRNPNLTDACSHLIETMMAKEPAERYGDWRALIADIDRVLHGKAPAAHRPGVGASVVMPAASRPGAPVPGPNAVAPASAVSKADLARQAQEALARQHQASAKAPAAANAPTTPRRRSWLATVITATAIVGLVLLSVVVARSHGRAAAVKPDGTDRTDRTGTIAGTVTGQPVQPPSAPAATTPPKLTPALPVTSVAPEPVATSPAPAAAPDSAAAAPAPSTAAMPKPAHSDLSASDLDLMDLAAWTTAKPGGWTLKDGVLAVERGGGYLWTRMSFEDFVLDLEFKLEPSGNSGVFVRTADTADPVHTGREIQVADLAASYGGTVSACGAIWGVAAPSKDAAKPPGQWNRMTISCTRNVIEIVLNDVLVTRTDRESPRTGPIGLQEMGTPVWYRNLRIRRHGTAAAPDPSRPGAPVPAPPAAVADPAAPDPAQAKLAALLADMAGDLVAGRPADALLRWQAGCAGPELKPMTEQVTAISKIIGEVTSIPQHVLESFQADVCKTVDIELVKEKITCEIREITAAGIRVTQTVKQGQGTGKLGRTIALGELSLQERLRRLGTGDAPELNLQRGLLALEAGQPDDARRLFAKAGGPLGEALVAQIDARLAEASEAAAEQALSELLRQISGSPEFDDQAKVTAAIRKRCEGDLKRVQAARKLLAEFEKEWGVKAPGKMWVPILQEALAYPPRQDWTVPELGLGLVWVAPGSFHMGSDDAKDNGAKPVHAVRISRGYWIGKYEVTQAEYEQVTGKAPSQFKGVRNPVERVSWDDAVAFCTKLTEREQKAGRLPTGHEYRLPTEAEWEYAARGGAGSKGYSYAGSDYVDEVAWYHGNSGDRRLDESQRHDAKALNSNHSKAHSVGLKKPNELGLYDMSGNVLEWCYDWLEGSYYARSPETDPVNLQAGSARVLRGACWCSIPVGCRSMFRYGEAPGIVGCNIGFRVCLGPAISAAAP